MVSLYTLPASMNRSVQRFGAAYERSRANAHDLRCVPALSGDTFYPLRAFRPSLRSGPAFPCRTDQIITRPPTSMRARDLMRSLCCLGLTPLCRIGPCILPYNFLGDGGDILFSECSLLVYLAELVRRDREMTCKSLKNCQLNGTMRFGVNSPIVPPLVLAYYFNIYVVTCRL